MRKKRKSPQEDLAFWTKSQWSDTPGEPTHYMYVYCPGEYTHRSTGCPKKKCDLCILTLCNNLCFQYLMHII